MQSLLKLRKGTPLKSLMSFDKMKYSYLFLFNSHEVKGLSTAYMTKQNVNKKTFEQQTKGTRKRKSLEINLSQELSSLNLRYWLKFNCRIAELKRVRVVELTISAGKEFHGFTIRLQKKCFEVSQRNFHSGWKNAERKTFWSWIQWFGEDVSNHHYC